MSLVKGSINFDWVHLTIFNGLPEFQYFVKTVFVQMIKKEKKNLVFFNENLYNARTHVVRAFFHFAVLNGFDTHPNQFLSQFKYKKRSRNYLRVKFKYFWKIQWIQSLPPVTLQKAMAKNKAKRIGFISPWLKPFKFSRQKKYYNRATVCARFKVMQQTDSNL